MTGIQPALRPWKQEETGAFALAPYQSPTRSPTSKASSSSKPLAPHSTFDPIAARPLSSSPSVPSAVAPKNAMATSPFLPQQPSFRTTMTGAQSAYVGHPAINPFDRDQSLAVGTPFNANAAAAAAAAAAAVAPTSVRIRRLPLNTSDESIRLMLVFSKELLDVELLPADKSEDPGFRSAILTFKTPAGAQEVKSMLDGKSNISNDAELIVEVIGGPANGARRYTNGEAPPTTTKATSSSSASSAASSATSSATSSRQPSRFTSNGAFASSEAGIISPPINTAAYGAELGASDPNSHYQSIFSPHSPIGNHLTEQRTRMSGKTLINDAADDDETGELLKDPLAYAENGAMATQARRATAPQLPISRMAGLSLNTNAHSVGVPYGPSPISQLSAHPNTMSPTMMNTSGTPNTMGYLSGHRYPGHSFPPVNPADQNPPCNTLYVGNLPIDTSEEELKATFSKQRGYKRLCFRTKQNGPMCFVEFEDVSFATKALHDLYGHMLHNSVKGGIRLSFSKNPLGVRSGQNQVGSNVVASPMSSLNGMMTGGGVPSFGAANGPPPGLAAPPGLGGPASGRSSSAYAPVTSPTVNGPLMTGASSTSSATVFSPPSNIWNTPSYGSTMMAGGPASVTGGSDGFPSFMMGR